MVPAYTATAKTTRIKILILARKDVKSSIASFSNLLYIWWLCDNIAILARIVICPFAKCAASLGVPLVLFPSASL